MQLLPPRWRACLLLGVLTALIGTASAQAAEPIGQPTGSPPTPLESMSGTIQVQRNALNGQLSLGRGNLSLDATLTDTGPEGQFSLGVPDRFSISLARVEDIGQSTICAVVGPQEVTVGAAQGSGVHVEFHAADPNAPDCVPAPVTALELHMAPFLTVAQTTPEPSSGGGGVVDDGFELLRRLIVLGVTASLLFLFAPALSRPLAVAAGVRPWSRLGLGLCMLITVPIIGVLIFVLGLSLGLWWLGLLVLASFAFFIALSAATAGLVLGASMLERIHQPHLPSAVMFGLGLLVITVLGLLPVVGAIVNVLAVIYGAGALLLLPRSREPQPTAIPVSEPSTTFAEPQVQPPLAGEAVPDGEVSGQRAA